MHNGQNPKRLLCLFLSFLSMCALSIPAYAHTFKPTLQKTADQSIYNLKIDYDIENNHYIYADSVKFTINTPALKITGWTTEKPAIATYDAAHSTQKEVYQNSGAFIVTLEKHDKNTIPEKVCIDLKFLTDANPPVQMHQFCIKKDDFAHIKQIKAEEKSFAEPIQTEEKPATFTQKISQKLATVKNYTSDLVRTTESPWIRVLLVFLLGLLMSLTPCIYPMIPITVGILQTGGKKTLGSNFARALSYTLGIATTFAVMGLLAASGSAQFGALMGNKVFVIFLVIFLGYFGLSMFGLYEIYIPTFLQPKQQNKMDGSLISAFILGVISGTFASPCLSPGLLLLLSIVVTIGNKLLGFILLFAFGFGIGIPLLLIGTFSGALNYLPRAGTWMLEIKKIFGMLLIGMCFFYLSNIMPSYLVVLLLALFLFIMGIMYTVSIASFDSKGMRRYKYFMAIVCMVISFITGLYAYKIYTGTKKPQHSAIMWLADYDKARTLAQEEDKKLLLDFTASWCSACQEIEHSIFNKPEIVETIKKVVPVKVDCTDPSEASCKKLQEQYGVLGYPTIILVDPTTEKQIKQWGGELLDAGQKFLVTYIE